MCAVAPPPNFSLIITQKSPVFEHRLPAVSRLKNAVAPLATPRRHRRTICRSPFFCTQENVMEEDNIFSFESFLKQILVSISESSRGEDLCVDHQSKLLVFFVRLHPFSCRSESSHVRCVSLKRKSLVCGAGGNLLSSEIRQSAKKRKERMSGCKTGVSSVLAGASK